MSSLGAALVPDSSTNGTPRPPAVLLLQRVLPPYRVSLFQALARSAHMDITVAYGEPARNSALQSVCHPEGVRIVTLENRRPFGDDRLVYQDGWGRLVRGRRFDVVIAEFNPRIVSNLLACYSARMGRLPFIWWGHGFGRRRGRRHWYSSMRVKLASMADALIFYDAEQSELFGEYGIAQDKRFVAPNALDTDRIAQLASGDGRARRHRVLYIGRLIEDKKVALLLSGFAAALPYLPSDTQLAIVGDGPERSRLERLAASLGIAARTEFLGAVYDEAGLAPVFNTSWVSVSPGCLGLSAVHSAAYGLPLLVARDERHGPEIGTAVDGANAWYFVSGGSADLSRLLIALSHDEAKWQEMSRSSLEIIGSKAGLRAMVDAFERAVRFVLSRP